MADAAHVVEIPTPIPVEQDHQNQNQKLICLAIQQHPLREISQSPGHLLLLKLWQREEHLFGLRMGRRETRMESLKQQIFQLCCFFLLFHALALTLLFTASEDGTCRRWWVPAVSVGATSAVMTILVQARVWAYWKTWGRLQRDRDSNRALLRCVQELRMKGGSFNLSKEPNAGKRMKSSSVEIKWGPLTWCARNVLAVSLLCSAGVVLAASRFLLCG